MRIVKNTVVLIALTIVLSTVIFTVANGANYETQLPDELVEYIKGLPREFDTFSGLPTGYDLSMMYGGMSNTAPGLRSTVTYYALTVGPGAYYGGKVTYSAPQEARFRVYTVFVRNADGTFEQHYIEVPGWGGGSPASRTGMTQTAIPEFPTIALPVGIIIGLLLFFSYRKRNNKA